MEVIVRVVQLHRPTPKNPFSTCNLSLRPVQAVLPDCSFSKVQRSLQLALNHSSMRTQYTSGIDESRSGFKLCG